MGEQNKWKIRLQLTKPVTWAPLIWGVLCGAAASGKCSQHRIKIIVGKGKDNDIISVLCINGLNIFNLWLEMQAISTGSQRMWLSR